MAGEHTRSQPDHHHKHGEIDRDAPGQRHHHGSHRHDQPNSHAAHGRHGDEPHHHDEPHAHGVAGNLRIAFGINVLFTLIELAGGLLTNSIAIMADAVHDLGDSVTLVLEKISGRPRTRQLTFGYRRFSTLGALITGMVLIVGAITVLIHAVPRLINPEPVDGTGMLALAILGVVMNALAALRLSKTESMNGRVVFLHLLEDVLGWIGVLLGGIAIRVWDIYLIDPILSVAINLFVLFRAVPILLKALRVLLQYAPQDLSADAVARTVRALPRVEGVHDIHLWTLDGTYTVTSLHVVTAGEAPLADLEELKTTVRNALSEMGVNHTTVELEASQAGCDGCDL